MFPAQMQDGESYEKPHLGGSATREYKRIAPSLEPVEFSAGSVLCESGEPLSHVYFPNTGMVSLVSLTDDRSFLEVGMIGSEGIVGIWAILGLNRMPQRAVVQLAGHAMKMKLGQ